MLSGVDGDTAVQLRAKMASRVVEARIKENSTNAAVVSPGTKKIGEGHESLTLIVRSSDAEAKVLVSLGLNTTCIA